MLNDPACPPVLAPQACGWIPQIHPHSVFKRTWDLVMMFVILYSVIVVPYRIMFNVESLGSWFILECIFDVLFAIDIVFCFLTSCVVPPPPPRHLCCCPIDHPRESARDAGGCVRACVWAWMCARGQGGSGGFRIRGGRRGGRAGGRAKGGGSGVLPTGILR